MKMQETAERDRLAAEVIRLCGEIEESHSGSIEENSARLDRLERIVAELARRPVRRLEDAGRLARVLLAYLAATDASGEDDDCPLAMSLNAIRAFVDRNSGLAVAGLAALVC
jgi:hypothetical protein